MAAYDFGMAKARGLIAPIQEAEAALIDKAGGRNVFKSDDWWNDQYNKTIREGISTPRKEYLMESYGGMFSGVTTSWMPVKTAGSGMVPRKTMPNARYENGAPITRLNTNVMEQKDLTQAQLDSITAASKAATKTAKAESAKSEATSKRLKRATGGLLAKAPIPGTEGMATGLPILGEGGLGLTASILGAGQKL